MGVKYVKDFMFPSSGGFHGDVQRYAKGGHVTKMPAKAKASAKGVPARAKPNAPAKGAPKMASKPAVGKRQGYNEGGRVPGYEMDRLPTKRPPGRMKDLAPARRFKGEYEGYAEGGPVAEITEGDGMSPLQAMALPEAPMYDAPMGKRGREFEPVDFDPGNRNRDLLRRMQEVPSLPPDDPRLLPSLPPGYEPPMLGGDLRDLVMSTMPVPVAAPEPYYPVGPKRPDYLDLPPVGALTPLPEEPQYLEPLPPLDVFGPSGLNKGPAAFDLPAPRTRADIADARRAAMSERAGMRQDMARPRGLGRAVMRARDKIASRMKVPSPVSRMRAEVLPAPMAPVRADRSIMEEPYYGGMVNPAVLPAFKKGGEVKGKKIGKVMREYKEGKLHSGSKKGPKVTSEKQAMAIALSEARKAGAKIPKKAEGGIFNDEYMAYQSKGPKTRGTARKGREQGRRERRAREAMEHAEMYAPGKSLDMADRKNRGGMPVHRRKPMYGGGKC